jgi:dolichol-phosphate mannosyltransferase
MSFLIIVVISILKLVYGIAPWGWSSLVSIMLAIGGLQFAFIGIIGEYIARILIETKNRPSYIIKDKYCESDENN